MAMASDLKTGSYFRHNNEILRLVRKEVVAYGTHSHSKLKLYVQSLDKKGEKTLTMHHTDKVELLNIMRKSAQVIALTGGKASIMDTVNYETHDAMLPESMSVDLKEGDEVTFIDLEGKVIVIEKR